MQVLKRLVMFSLCLILFAVTLDAQTGNVSSASDSIFDYSGKQPLDIHDKIIEDFGAGELHDITYPSPQGGPVAAYLVIPKGKGPFAAILFGYWGNGTRAEFIPEAKIYAAAGAVALLPDYPWDRPKPWRQTVEHIDKPEMDRQAEIHAVVDLRRGIDLLLARPDVDPRRLAYVGHSYGAQWGAILSAVDKRIKTAVLMAGVAAAGDLFFGSDDPGLIELRESQPAEKLSNYVKVVSDLDAARFVGRAAPVALLLQFANYEQYFNKASMRNYIAAASEPKKVLHYDTGHDLNDPQALQDRYQWLVDQIGIRPQPIFANSHP